MDVVFKALADPTRRALLDRLHERNGQTLGELCASARHGAAVGDPAPGRARGGQPRQHHPPGPGETALPQPGPAARDPGTLDREVRAPAAARAERHQTTSRGGPWPKGRRTSTSPTSRARPERVWHALTDADLTAAVLGPQQRVRTGSRARAGSTCAPTAPASPTSAAPCSRADAAAAAGDDVRGPGRPPAGPSRVTFDIEPCDDIVRLTVTHEDLADEAERAVCRPAGRPCCPTSSPCWRPATCCRARRGRCTPSARRGT